MELRQNARETLTKISKKTSIPVSTIHDKIRSYQENLINKHTTLIDFSKLGFNSRANIMIKVNSDAKEEAKKFLLNHDNVNSVYKISSGFDFLIEGIFRNIKDSEEFIDAISRKFNLKQIQVNYIVEDIKKESFMNDKESLKKVLKEHEDA
ncbi:Lrp/AsnC ligand binding domain-containing protein [Candidatus Woesearchaeota archaeon]|nr:Lrp/AsnC ligand binding domain-containing protein [Candidatus Woesearchaeota archaeon]